MKKYTVPLFLAVILLLVINSCKKESASSLVEGTYNISGWLIQSGDSIHPYDSTSVPAVQLQVTKVDYNNIAALCPLPSPFTLHLEERKDISEVYYFEGISTSGGSAFGARIFFYKNDIDSVFADYAYQIDSTTVYTYNLAGKKR